MRIFRSFDSLPPLRHPVVTMGSYDGVHTGHRQLLARIVRIAGSIEGESVVVTFSPHPRRVLNPGSGRFYQLNSIAEKAMLLAGRGIDNLIVAPFNEEFSRISPYNFVREYLIGKIGMRTLVVGYNHHFGHNKEGDYDFLSRLQSEFDFEVYKLPRQEVDDRKVSSTVIRQLIGEGEMATAARYLGQPYFALLHRMTDGTLHTDSPDKLLPPPGEYRVGVTVWNENAALSSVNQTDTPTAATFTIAASGKMELTPPPHADDFIVTFN